MKTVTVSPQAKGINQLLKKARRENLIVRSPDGTEFVLAEIDDFDREIELTRHNKQLMKFLNRRGRERKTIPLDEAKAMLDLDQAG